MHSTEVQFIFNKCCYFHVDPINQEKSGKKLTENSRYVSEKKCIEKPRKKLIFDQ